MSASPTLNSTIGRDEALFSTSRKQGEAILMYTTPKIIASLDVTLIAAEAHGDSVVGI